jgi:DNA-binding transcriptional LysR family regulator
MFYEVIECGSVTKAAERLRVSQPAVTAQLRKLERELGLTLFRPQGRGIAPTEAGRWLADRARVLFALERDIERGAQLIRLGEKGTLRIAATYLPANMLLPGWVANWKRAHPEIDIVLTTSNSREALDRLLHYEADLAVVGGGRPLPAGLRREQVLYDELCFIVSSGHPLAGRNATRERVLAEPIVAREKGSSGRELLAAICQMHGVPAPLIGLQCSGTAETIRAVASGYGTALASALEVRDSVERGEVSRITVDGVRIENPIGLYLRAGEAPPPAAENFATYIRARRSEGSLPGQSRS